MSPARVFVLGAFLVILSLIPSVFLLSARTPVVAKTTASEKRIIKIIHPKKIVQIVRFVTSGIASWYDLPGNRMANGDVFRSRDHVCAMRYEPFEETVKIVNLDNGRVAYCVVRDRGPFVSGRVIDVSPAVRDDLSTPHQSFGLARVRVYVVH